MNERSKTIDLIADMLQRADARTVRFICVLLGAMLGEEAVA